MPEPPSTDKESFIAHLNKSTRIIAVLGAGLSASSGLPTFRGAGGYWRRYDATALASPNAFRNDPGLVWQFYSYRRHMALNAKPNRAHYALAQLAKKRPEFLTLSQNVDNLSPRAGHPAAQLKLLHGNLFDVKCWDEATCGYVKRGDFTDPIAPALALPEDRAAVDLILKERVAAASRAGEVKKSFLEAHLVQKIAKGAGSSEAAPAAAHDDDDDDDDAVSSSSSWSISSEEDDSVAPQQIQREDLNVPFQAHPLIRGVDIADANIPIVKIPKEDLPQCPKCQNQVLRPGVVWFGEKLPKGVIRDADRFVQAPERIDLCLVIGTSSRVWPAAGYAAEAKDKGARIAVFNMDQTDARDLDGDDWFFEGDAAVLVPELLHSVVGDIVESEELQV